MSVNNFKHTHATPSLFWPFLVKAIIHLPDSLGDLTITMLNENFKLTSSNMALKRGQNVASNNVGSYTNMLASFKRAFRAFFKRLTLEASTPLLNIYKSNGKSNNKYVLYTMPITF